LLKWMKRMACEYLCGSGCVVRLWGEWRWHMPFMWKYLGLCGNQNVCGHWHNTCQCKREQTNEGDHTQTCIYYPTSNTTKKNYKSSHFFNPKPNLMMSLHFSSFYFVPHFFFIYMSFYLRIFFLNTVLNS